MNKKVNKEKYEKPALKSIQLKADEVLAIGCKSTFSSGPELAGCGQATAPCSASGS
jgi:hypothetical protein